MAAPIDPPPSVVEAAREAGFTGNLLASPDAAARAGLSHRALLARHRRSATAGRPEPAAFADPRTRSDGRTVTWWFPVEHLDAIAGAASPLTPGPAPGAARSPGDGDPFAGPEVVHAFELEVERLRGQLAAQVERANAAEDRAAAAEAEVARLRAAIGALTAAP